MGRIVTPAATTVEAWYPLDGPFGIGAIKWFYQSGTFIVPSGITTVRARVWGGGAGGKNGSGGGGAGGFSIKTITGLTPGSSIAVTVGAGGAFDTGAAGGTSSFGTHCSATGGNWSGLGGSGSGGDIDRTGGRSYSTLGSGGSAANLFANGHDIAGGYGLLINGTSGLIGIPGIGSINTASTTVAPAAPAICPELGTFSIDYVGCGPSGGGGSSAQNLGTTGLNGGGNGAFARGAGSVPGGGGAGSPSFSGGSSGGNGLVIVEY